MPCHCTTAFLLPVSSLVDMKDLLNALPGVDLTDPASIEALFEAVGEVDAIVSAAVDGIETGRTFELD